MTRMLENNVKQIEYILPVKFDETKVPGILGTIGFVDGKKKTPEELGKLIINKISKKNDIQNSCVTVEEFKEYMIKLLTSDLPYYWAVSNNEFDSYIEFRYSFSNFDYFLKIIMEQDENTILVIGEYTDAFCDKHIFVPSAKICLDINDKTITNAKIINIDFFDSLELDISTPFEVIEQIKKQILKKGGE